VSDFRELVSALEGLTVKVANNNIKGLWQLCEEFRFRDLAGQLSQFRESSNCTGDAVLLSALKIRILTMEEQLHHGKREIASLRRELSRCKNRSRKEFERKPSQRFVEQMKSNSRLVRFEAQLKLFVKRSAK
jgi:hypothetical protein